MNARYKILLLESADKKDESLRQILIEKGYHTECYYNIEQAIERIMNKSVDLIISDNNVMGNSGFAVFKSLAKYLRNTGVPFFLVLENYAMEYIVFGLEIGIDNFIFSPLNKDSVCSKIENQLRKREQLNIFESGNFLEYFQSSSVAMFFVSKNQIYLVNDAFNTLFNGFGRNFMELPVDNIFNIADNKENELAYQRFRYEVSEHCKLNNVPCFSIPNYSYNISLYQGNNNGFDHFFGEIIPSVFTDFVMSSNGDLIPEIENRIKMKRDDKNNQLSGGPKLTQRQQQVYELSARGLPIKIIASRLNLSEGTVEKHRENIMLKTKAKNIIEAIVRIQMNPHHLLDLPERR